jgi:hypothetical protein
MKITWPSWWAILFLALSCTAAAFVTFRVAAQNAPAAAAAAAQDTPAGRTPARPPPSKPEASATIPDDPTLVPDPKESADNNVTFPVDI